MSGSSSLVGFLVKIFPAPLIVDILTQDVALLSRLVSFSWIRYGLPDVHGQLVRFGLGLLFGFR